MNSKRHPRQPNFSVKEEEILLALVKENSNVITRKKSGAYSSLEKRRVWNEIKSKFGVLSGINRDVKSLIYKYENLKRKARRKLAKQRREGGDDDGQQSDDVDSAERLGELLGIAKVECIEASVDCFDNNSTESITIHKQEPKRNQEPEDFNELDDELMLHYSDAADWNGFENTQRTHSKNAKRHKGQPENSDELSKSQLQKFQNEDMRAEEKFEWERKQAEERHEWQRQHAEEKHEWERQQAEIKLKILMIELKNKERN